jgi:hypothetical protein
VLNVVIDVQIFLHIKNKIMKRENFKEFQERLKLDLNLENDEDNIKLSTLIYFTSVFCAEQKLNWRRQIVNIKKLINTTIKNSKQK